MSLNQIINLLVTITLIEMMAAIGLNASFKDVVVVAKKWRLMGKALVANYVIVPAITVGLLYVFKPHPMVAVGFLILSACPGAPYGSPFTAIAKGDVPLAIGLMVVLAASSAILAPLLLGLLLQGLDSQEPINVDAARLIGTLLFTQLVPLAIGLAIAHWLPNWANKLKQPANLASKVLNLVAITLIVAVQFPMLAQIRPMGFLGMLILLVATLAAGWLMGGRGIASRKSMALTTSLRNAGVGMVVASSSFAGTPVLTTVLAYAIVELAGGLLFALGCGRARNSGVIPAIQESAARL